MTISLLLLISNAIILTNFSPLRVYLSEPFGFCSFYSVAFDDFTAMMPLMMSKGQFDLDKTARILEIEFLEWPNKNIFGMRESYLVPYKKGYEHLARRIESLERKCSSGP